MKFLFDFLPVLLFFIAFKLYDIYIATAVAIAGSIAQTGWLWLRYRRIERMPLFTLLLIVVLGGSTLIFHDEYFIKWKPTAVNWLFAVVFLGSQWVGQKPILERMLSENLELPAPVWLRLNLAWVGFFLTMGLANLYVALNFDTETWVDFKLFGMLTLTLIFVIAQAIYLARHIKPDTKAS